MYSDMAHQPAPTPTDGEQRDIPSTANGLEIEERTVRAAEEYLVAVEQDVPGLFWVFSEDGTPHTVDGPLGACDCKDMQYNNPEDGCKHIRRVELLTGKRPIAPLLLADDVRVDKQLIVRRETYLEQSDTNATTIQA